LLSHNTVSIGDTSAHFARWLGSGSIQDLGPSGSRRRLHASEADHVVCQTSKWRRSTVSTSSSTAARSRICTSCRHRRGGAPAVIPTSSVDRCPARIRSWMQMTEPALRIVLMSHDFTEKMQLTCHRRGVL